MSALAFAISLSTFVTVVDISAVQGFATAPARATAAMVPSSTPLASKPAGVIPPEAGSSTAAPAAPPSVELGAPAWSVVYGFGGVWIQVDPPVDQLLKVDELSGAITLTIDAGTSAAMAEDAVWVTVGGVETRKIDPMTGEVLLIAETPDAYYVAVGAGAVWVPNEEGVSRIDPVNGEVIASIVLDFGVTDLAASDDAVWVTHKVAGMVSRIDPASNTIVATIETGAGAHDLAIEETGVWVTNYGANTVSRIDPATNTVVATIDGVGSGVGIVAGAGAIFVSTRANGISRIDPATNEAKPVVELGGWLYGLAYGDGELWVTNVDAGVVYRLDNPSLNLAGG